MIGRVIYGGGSIKAALNGRDDWSVSLGGKDHPGMARGLTALYRNNYRGPSDGHYGQRILNDLAKRTGGIAEIKEFPPEDSDTAC